LVGKLEVKRLFGRSRWRWKGNIRMDLRETVCERADWTQLAQDGDQ